MAVLAEPKNGQEIVIEKRERTEPNIIDMLMSIAKDIRERCSHVPGSLVENLTLEPSKKEGVFLAETERGTLKTYLVFCKDCGKELRLVVGKVCPNCFVEMQRINGPCEIGMFDRCEYLPSCADVGFGDTFFSVLQSQCPICKLTVVWDKFSHYYDYQVK